MGHIDCTCTMARNFANNLMGHTDFTNALTNALSFNLFNLQKTK